MSNDISKNDLSNFFIQKFHSNKVSIEDVKKLGINVEKFEYADENDDNNFDIDEIADVKELYAAFTAVVEKERAAVEEEKDADKEKEEKNKVKDKNGAGAA